MKLTTKAALAASLILLVWGGLPALVIFKSKDYAKAGQIGDTFGIVNSMFSALALAGAVATIYLQTKQLRQAVSDMNQQMLASTISSQLATLPELIREQRSLLQSLDGSFNPRDLTLAEIINELSLRASRSRRPLDVAKSNQIIETLHNLRELLEHQACLFASLRSMSARLATSDASAK